MGKGGRFRSFDKELSIPNHYYANLARWHQLAMMKTNGDLKGLQDLAKVAVEPEKLEKFIEIIEFDMGFSLYSAVSKAKIALSSQDETEFRFAGGDIESRVMPIAISASASTVRPASSPHIVIGTE